MDVKQSNLLSLFFCGDVMTGRGVDQVLPHPGDPTLYESYVRDAREYVRLAESANGLIQRPVSFKYIWGDALEVLHQVGVDLKIINLETSVTTSDQPWPHKAIHYRMHPDNIGCLTAAHIHACSLANNHVLDWGYEGLEETLQTLDRAGITHAGAGGNLADALAPAVLEVKNKGRVLLFAFGSITSGVPMEWGATRYRAGVNLLFDLSQATAERVAGQMREFQQPGDLMIASIHWGGNWGYEISPEQINFAHRLIDAGVAMVHGHSSHHVTAIEVYRGHLILYGCGDLLTDYEGISGYEEFRNDLSLMYLVQVDSQSGKLASARLVPMQTRRFQLHRALEADARWLCNLVSQLGKTFGTQAHLAEDNSMSLSWS